jgi:hypothetical protein
MMQFTTSYHIMTIITKLLVSKDMEKRSLIEGFNEALLMMSH